MHLHNHTRHTVYISPIEPNISESLRSYGINVIASKCINTLRENEQYHADMQICIINNTAFIPQNTAEIADILKILCYDVVICKPLNYTYPENISLNVAIIGDKLYCKESSLAKEIADFCKENKIEIVNVNQGYTKCSTLILNKKAIITSDSTICTAAENNSISVLRISPGNIYLQDADYGFIGGCSGVIGDTVYFFGDIETHPDSEEIVRFIKKQGMNYISLNKGMLKDIGGFVLLK